MVCVKEIRGCTVHRSNKILVALSMRTSLHRLSSIDLLQADMMDILRLVDIIDHFVAPAKVLN